MRNINKYWFYLEPFTFIFKSNNRFVIYNTLNSSYLKVPENPLLSKIMLLLDDASNGYCIVLDEEDVSDPLFNQFSVQVKQSNSGNLVVAESDISKPFIFKPILFLNTDIRKVKEEDIGFLGVRLLENLNEVSIYLPGICYLNCSNCKYYYKQMLHCTLQDEKKLSVVDYLSLLLDLNASGVKKVNILGGDLLKNEYLEDLLPTLIDCKFKKCFHVHFDNLNESYRGLLKTEDTGLVVSVHSSYSKENITTKMNMFSDANVVWKFLVSSEEDLQNINCLDIQPTVKMELTPFYTKQNLPFFVDNVFYTLNDLLTEPVSSKTIFRRQTLNENFFGKLTFLPTGEVYANLNCDKVGKYPEDSLKKLVFEELTNSTAWFRLRDQKPCNHCFNKYICPSISNCELVMGRDNLCLIEE